MKKFLSLLLGLLFLVFLSFPKYSFAIAEGATLDQAYESLSTEQGGPLQYWIDNQQNAIQTFTPTKNAITDIQVYLKDRVPDTSIRFYLTDGSGNVISVGYTNKFTESGDGWETFSFNEPYLSVIPGQKYGIKLLCNNTQTLWYYNLTYTSGLYTRGYFFPTPGTDWDALFRVYTKDYQGPEGDRDSGDNGETGDADETATGNSNNANSSISTTSAAAGSTKKSATKDAKEAQKTDKKAAKNALQSYEKIEIETLDWIFWGVIIWAGLSILGVLLFYYFKKRKKGKK